MNEQTNQFSGMTIPESWYWSEDEMNDKIEVLKANIREIRRKINTVKMERVLQPPIKVSTVYLDKPEVATRYQIIDLAKAVFLIEESKRVECSSPDEVVSNPFDGVDILDSWYLSVSDLNDEIDEIKDEIAELRRKISLTRKERKLQPPIQGSSNLTGKAYMVTRYQIIDAVKGTFVSESKTEVVDGGEV